jgi:hypothetical protein
MQSTGLKLVFNGQNTVKQSQTKGKLAPIGMWLAALTDFC